MFKKKNRSTARSTIRKTESSSEDDSLPPLRSAIPVSSTSTNSSIQKVFCDHVVDIYRVLMDRVLPQYQ